MVEHERRRTPSPRATRTPLHLLTGFLGAGKTTLLRRLLATPDNQIGALVNEVADLGIDDRLIADVDEDVLMLPGGCACCALRGELHAAVTRILANDPARIVLETSGIADPAPILHTLATDPVLADRIELTGVIAVVDCLTADRIADRMPEARRQLDFADRVVLTRTDLAPDRVDAARDALRHLAPGREVRAAIDGRIDPDWLFAAARFAAEPRRWLAAIATDGSRHAPFSTHVVRRPHAVDRSAVQLWLRLMTQLDGERLPRIKGVVRDADGAAWALQSAGRSVSPPLRLAVDVAGAEIVVIERGMPAAALTRLLDGLGLALDALR